MKHSTIYNLVLFVLLLLIVSCGRPFTAVAPEGFATYKSGINFRSVSPDHIVYRVRTCANQPYAEFEFWREALPQQMKNAGYRIIDDTVLTVSNNKSLLLELAAPLGEADYSYLVMIMVKKEKILIAEAAGLYDDFQRRKPEIIAALGKAVLN
jgi:hypothetical protein